MLLIGQRRHPPGAARLGDRLVRADFSEAPCQLSRRRSASRSHGEERLQCKFRPLLPSLKRPLPVHAGRRDYSGPDCRGGSTARARPTEANPDPPVIHAQAMLLTMGTGSTARALSRAWKLHHGRDRGVGSRPLVATQLRSCSGDILETRTRRRRLIAPAAGVKDCPMIDLALFLVALMGLSADAPPQRHARHRPILPRRRAG